MKIVTKFWIHVKRTDRSHRFPADNNNLAQQRWGVMGRVGFMSILVLPCGKLYPLTNFGAIKYLLYKLSHQFAEL